MECIVHLLVGFGVRRHKPGVGSLQCSAVWLTCKTPRCSRHPSTYWTCTARVWWAICILKMSDHLTQCMFYTGSSWAGVQEGLRSSPKSPRKKYSPVQADKEDNKEIQTCDWLSRVKQSNWTPFRRKQWTLGLRLWVFVRGENFGPKPLRLGVHIQHWRTDATLGTAPLPAGVVMRNSRKIGNEL